MDVTNIEKILKRISLTLIIIAVMIGFGFAGLFVIKLAPIDADSDKTIMFEVKNGWGVNQTLSELEKAGLIKSTFMAKVYAKINNIDSLYAGNYKVSKSMSASELIEAMANGENIENEVISVTFVEGKRFPYYVTKISETFGFKEEDVYKLTNDQEYLNKLINDYWFITNDILNEQLYYPLEGYLFADTYEFKKSSTIEEVIGKMLDRMEEKLNMYKEDIDVSGKSIHSLLTMASVIELEAVTPEDRLLVAGVFYNRLDAKDSLGSDVTTYYGVKKDITESLYQSEINRCNAYNTRGNCNKGVLPVGPIAVSSESSIIAAITPTKTKNYYFVADIYNKLYFAETESGHNKNIRDLINKGIWPE